MQLHSLRKLTYEDRGAKQNRKNELSKKAILDETFLVRLGRVDILERNFLVETGKTF